MLLLHQWAQAPDGALRAFVWGPALVTLAFVQTIVILIGMMSRQSTDAVREWWSRLGAWLAIDAVVQTHEPRPPAGGQADERAVEK